MNNKINSTVLISGLVCLVLGVGIGLLYKTLQTSHQQLSPQQIEKTTATIKDLSSKIILSSVAYGQVSKIEGRDITLSYNGDSIKINITENIPIYSFTNDSAGKSVQKKVDLKVIKIGDTLNITIKVLPDGQIQSQSVLILRSISTSK